MIELLKSLDPIAQALVFAWAVASLGYQLATVSSFLITVILDWICDRRGR